MAHPVLRVGVAGVGIMGADHATRLATRIAGAQLVAVADPAIERVTELADQLGVTAYADPLEMIAAGDIDAVLVASPGFVHEEQVLACIEQRKPVLCEKPLTMDGESSLRLVEAEARGGRPLVQVGFMRRFDPEYAALRQTLSSGRLGRLLLLHNTHRNKSVPNRDFRSEMIVRDSLVHEIDVARFLFGEEVAEISIFTPTPTSYAASGVLDPQVAVFTMAGGGMVTNEVFVNAQVGYEVRAEAVCELGSVQIGRPASGVYSTMAEPRAGEGYWGGLFPADYRERFARAYDLEIQAWIDASRRAEVIGATSYDGYAATVVSSAGIESLATGRPVPVHLAERPAYVAAH